MTPAGCDPAPRYHPAVIPVLVLAAGVAALVAGFLVLASYGSHYRVARLLATTARVSVDDALDLADRAEQRYVRVDGRLDSDEEFEDHDHRPLVFRRSRLLAQEGRAWEQLGERREQVPFEVREGLAGIGVDADALDRGLVVVTRETAGVAADIADRVPPSMPPATPVRFEIDQVSSVEHAIVLGVPVRTDGSGAMMTAGLGRPLILTTLELPEAMRVLAGGALRPRVAAALLGAGVVLAGAGVIWLVVEAVL